ALALACVTAYEAWQVTACALTALTWTYWRRGEPLPGAVRRVARIALSPALAVIAFVLFSRVVVGQWFVSGDFFVPENKSLHDLRLAAAEIVWGLRAMSGTLLVVAGGIGMGASIVIGLVRRPRRPN